MLQVLEAVRLHAAANKGALPEKLDDVDVPLPVDPFTGKAFRYAVKDGKATLTRHAAARGGEDGGVQHRVRDQDREVSAITPATPSPERSERLNGKPALLQGMGAGACGCVALAAPAFSQGGWVGPGLSPATTATGRTGSAPAARRATPTIAPTPASAGQVVSRTDVPATNRPASIPTHCAGHQRQQHDQPAGQPLARRHHPRIRRGEISTTVRPSSRPRTAPKMAPWISPNAAARPARPFPAASVPDSAALRNRQREQRQQRPPQQGREACAQQRRPGRSPGIAPPSLHQSERSKSARARNKPDR